MTKPTKGKAGHIYKFGSKKNPAPASITDATKEWVKDLGFDNWDALEYLRIADEKGYLDMDHLKDAMRLAKRDVEKEYDKLYVDPEERRKEAKREWARRQKKNPAE